MPFPMCLMGVTTQVFEADAGGRNRNRSTDQERQIEECEENFSQNAGL